MMNTKTPPLRDILAYLLRQTTPTKRQLSGKLILAYTPGSCNSTEPGTHRLTLSRRGVWPSDKEVEVIRRELRLALKAQNRAIADTIYVEPYLKVENARSPTRRILYHVLFWKELEQLSIL